MAKFICIKMTDDIEKLINIESVAEVQEDEKGSAVYLWTDADRDVYKCYHTSTPFASIKNQLEC